MFGDDKVTSTPTLSLVKAENNKNKTYREKNSLYKL